MSEAYVHGYSAAEMLRLNCQAGILAPFIHHYPPFPAGSRILEAGCGVGAQTLALAGRNPDCTIVAVDREAESLRVAQEKVAGHSLRNVEFHCSDLLTLPFGAGEFDAVFLCFVLEHLTDMPRALAEIRRVLRPGATVLAFEGDHGTVVPSPDHCAIAKLVSAVSEYQRRQGGDPCIGRRLCAVLGNADFADVCVEPCVAYADATRPLWIERFTHGTFIDMMKIQRDTILSAGLLDAAGWQEGIDALQSTTRGSFSYTFYRATARR